MLPGRKSADQITFFTLAIVGDEKDEAADFRVIERGEEKPALVAELIGLPFLEPPILEHARDWVMERMRDVEHVGAAEGRAEAAQGEDAPFHDRLGRRVEATALQHLSPSRLGARRAGRGPGCPCRRGPPPASIRRAVSARERRGRSTFIARAESSAMRRSLRKCLT